MNPYLPNHQFLQNPGFNGEMDGYDLMSLNADQLLELLGDEFAFARLRTAKLFDDAIH